MSVSGRRLIRRVGRRDRQQFRDAFAYASIGLAIVDAEGRVEQANPAFAALVEADPRSLAGASFADLLEPAARPELDRVFGTVRAVGGLGTRLEARVRHHRGLGRWALVAVSRADQAGRRGRLVVQLEDIQDRKAVEAKLAHQATHDLLTGLPNRADLLELAGSALAAQEAVAVLFVDLDRFKWVNDSLGHEAGDALLVEVADRLRHLLRPGDVVSRLGGDEFVVLAHRVRVVSSAVVLAERVALALRRPVELGSGREAYVTASIGIAIANPGDTPESLLRDADTAMYQAKAAGGAQHALFSPSMRAATLRHHEIEGALRRAVRADELEVVFQPKVRVTDRQVRGFEALVRWTDPTYGPVSPADFVPIAEESDLIAELGQVVLRRALAAAAQWPDLPDGSRPLLAVNVSRRQLVQPRFADVVAGLLAESGVAPSDVCLEVTETALTQNVESVVTALHGLRHLGVAVAIDDFGTGHASLTYLTRLPVDILKVDRLFVSGLGRDERSAAIVSSVSTMARAFGLLIIAEGVETDEQLDALRTLDVDLAQGYLFSPGVPAAQAAAMLGMQRREVIRLPGQRGHQRVPRRPLLVAPREDQRYRLMLDLARDVTGRLDLATVLDRTFAALRQLIDFTGGSVQFIDDTDHVSLAAADPPATAEAMTVRIPLGQGVSGKIALTGEPRYIPDILAESDVKDRYKGKSISGGVRSYFGVPLITEGRVIGLVQVDSVAIDAWDEADRTVVLAFAPIVAAAVQNARLFEREVAHMLRGADTG